MTEIVTVVQGAFVVGGCRLRTQPPEELKACLKGESLWAGTTEWTVTSGAGGPRTGPGGETQQVVVLADDLTLRCSEGVFPMARHAECVADPESAAQAS